MSKTLHYCKIIFLVVFGVFTCVNIWASQFIGKEYLDILNNREASKQVFFKILLEDEKVYVNHVTSFFGWKEYNSQNQAKNSAYQAQIETLTPLLSTNPFARDLLFALVTLYTKNGDIQTAQDYRHRAEEVDPHIGK